MTPLEAKRFGTNIMTKGAICLFIIFEFVFMLSETRGDFANGILFFIDGQQNIFFVSAVILYFLTNFFLGMLAGHLIIAKKKDYDWTAFLFGTLSCLLSLDIMPLTLFYSIIE